MEIASVMRESLEKKTAYQERISNKLDTSQCEESLKGFREKIIRTLRESPDSESIIKIPFPTPCGSHVKQLLANENIPYHVAVHTTVQKSNELIFHFDTEYYSARAVISKKL